MASLPSHGKLPPAVARQREIESRLSQEPLPELEPEVESSAAVTPGTAPRSAAPVRTVPEKNVKFKFNGGKFLLTVPFPVLDACLQDVCITLLYRSEHTLPFPKDEEVILVLEVEGVDYPVEFLGVFFESTALRLCGISFMHIRPTDDQTRQSSDG